MSDEKNAPARRYVCVVDPKVTSLDVVAGKLAQRGIAVDDRLDFISTLIIHGNESDVSAASGDIEGITSVEPEGTMRTQ